MKRKNARESERAGWGFAASSRVVAWIFLKEVVDLLRDRRAVFFAFVLPLLLYPLFFLFTFAQQGLQLEELAARELPIGLAGDSRAFVSYLGEHNLVEAVEPVEPADVRSGRVPLLVRVAAPSVAEREGAALDVTLFHVTTSVASQEARRRVKHALEEFEAATVRERFRLRSVDIPAAGLVSVEATNVASPEELSGASLGRFFPLLLVLLLVAGGSFAALDLLAGEKERGTLETLYLHPIPTDCVVWGKFLVVLCAAMVAVVLNLVGVVLAFWLSSRTGLSLPGMDGLPVGLPPLGALGGAVLLSAPLAVLSSAVLLSLSAYARSFREAQTYLLPLTLVIFVLLLPAMSPLTELTSVLAFLPFGNVALAVRDVLRERAELLPLVVVFVTTSAYAAVALRFAAGLLKKEEVVLRLEAPPLATEVTASGRTRRGIVFGCFMLLFVYFAGGALQSWHLYAGLALTLWVVVLLPALAYGALLKLPVRDLLGLRATRLENYVWVLAAAASALVLVAAYMRFQDEYLLPFPEVLEEAFRELLGDGELGPLWRFLLFAVSPGICEELLWRGAVQGEVAQRRRPLFTLAVSGLFFGLFHLSIYRFAGTAALGVVLAFVRLRTGSIFPCMLLHTAYNALAVFLLQPLVEAADGTGPLQHWGALAAAAAILFVSLRRLRGPL